MKGKIIFHGFVLLLFLVFLQRIIVNIKYYNEDLVKGIIYDSSSYKRGSNSATTYTYFIKDKIGKKYEDGGSSDTAEYGFLIGDRVTFRKLHNGSSTSVRMIKRNGEQVRNYYGFVDYASVICIILLILGYIFIPKLLKT
ncbi:hypothetical protein KHA90_18540 [Flavobacterium psychroterrae]|uniref:DUF3592 domain-containing protein n=1 Tax=Flavobacterium psychroterrae TaxID=2133767 RepID=A0ABS5PFE4_9FLAO|nr:hypothetical protein [Flavobacterium psychroterrae]MBS7233024.1 hypothetical protein [Flavobacterium psychroterrae]